MQRQTHTHTQAHASSKKDEQHVAVFNSKHSNTQANTHTYVEEDQNQYLLRCVRV